MLPEHISLSADQEEDNHALVQLTTCTVPHVILPNRHATTRVLLQAKETAIVVDERRKLHLTLPNRTRRETLHIFSGSLPVEGLLSCTDRAMIVFIGTCDVEKFGRGEVGVDLQHNGTVTKRARIVVSESLLQLSILQAASPKPTTCPGPLPRQIACALGPSCDGEA